MNPYPDFSRTCKDCEALYHEERSTGASCYQGEERVEFDGKPYEVVRAYTPPNGEKVELNLKEAPVAAKAAQEPPGEEGKG